MPSLFFRNLVKCFTLQLISTFYLAHANMNMKFIKNPAAKTKVNDREGTDDSGDESCITSSSSDSSPSYKDVDGDYLIKSYGRRWLILAISVFTRVLRGFNQSCYGVINNVLVDYMGVKPAHIDWLLLVQSVTFLFLSIPLSWLMCRMGFRKIYLLMITTITVGFTLIAVGMLAQELGYPSVLIGQMIIGISNIVSGIIPPLLASVWFPLSEVATAVAFNIAGRGVGETLGSILMPKLITADLSTDELGIRLVMIFGTSAVLSAFAMIVVLIFVTDKPPTPPSAAQKSMQKNDPMRNSSFFESLVLYKNTAIVLMQNRHFLTILFACGAVLPVVRYASILLSSILHGSFENHEELNLQAGYALTLGWVAYTISGYAAGPIISRTRAFKPVFLAGSSLVCLSCLSLLMGAQLKNMAPVYAAAIGFSIGVGISATASFEILIEVTYPNPILMVATVNGLGLGMFRLLYSIIGRHLLSNVDAVAACAFPMGMTMLAAFLLYIVDFPYHRTNTENKATAEIAEKNNNHKIIVKI